MNKWLGFILLSVLSVLSLSNTLSAKELSESEWLIKAEIQQLVNDYAIYRDRLDPEGYANVFAEDGEFLYRGAVFKGRDALKKRVKEADSARTTMHIMTSGQIRILDDTHAEGDHYATIYSKVSDDSLEEGAPIPVSNFAVMGIYSDEYILTTDGWKIAKRSLKSVFTAEK